MIDTLITIADWPGVKWVVLVLMFALPVASLLTWAERRQSAMIQDRLGPNRANIGNIRLWGILHFVADVIKMIGKEDFIPGNAHRGLFKLAPILALVPVLIAFCIIPFGPTIYPHALFDVISTDALQGMIIHGGVANDLTWADQITLQILTIDFGLIFYFAILTFANYGTTLAGWSSYNKLALLGGLRASSQMMSYEVTMGLSLMGLFLIMGTLEPGEIVRQQGPNPWQWGIVLQPVAFLLFFSAAIAETKRAPFDLPEGESEIVGYFVEYSGLRWGMFFLSEFIEIVFISMLITSLFFGGWQVPFLHDDGLYLFGTVTEMNHITVSLLRILSFVMKVFFFCWFQLMIRWTLPRFRPDQLMQLGWKRLLPLALLNTMVTALILLWIQ